MAADHEIPGSPGVKLTCEKCKLLGPGAAEKMGCHGRVEKRIVDKGGIVLHRCPWALLREAGRGGNLDYVFRSYDLRQSEPFSSQKAALVDAWGVVAKTNSDLRQWRMSEIGKEG